MFLKTFSFLFFRFRPGAHAFVLVVLLKNLAFALLPVITNADIDVFALTVVVVLCVMASCLVFPWVVHQANHLDICVHVGMLLILFLAALQTESAGGKLVGNMLVVFFVFMSCFGGAGVWCLYLLRQRFRKPFEFFLCHHKEGAGAFCRLLNVRLLRHRLVKRDVFLDSDNLRDLSLLFGIVREKTDTLVVLCSRDIFRRPCALVR